MSNNFKFGLIGAGGISSAYSAAISQIPNATLAAVVDCRPEAARALAAGHQANEYSSIAEMIEKESLDAVIVCTPPLYHRDHCIELMSAGIHVLCEKPLSIDSSSAVAMVKAAEENNVVFTMGSKFRFVDDVRVAKKMLDDGQLGDIVLYENCFTGVVDMTDRWNSDPDISGGGVLIDNGTHSLDIMRHFLGDLSEIRVVEGKRIQELPVEDTVHVFVRALNGAMGNIDLSWSLHKDLPHFISLYGTSGTVEIGWRESRFKMHGEKDWTTFGSGYNKVAAFQNQLENLMGAVRDNQSLVITPEDGVASVCTVETAYQAMQQSDWHEVPPLAEVLR